MKKFNKYLLGATFADNKEEEEKRDAKMKSPPEERPDERATLEGVLREIASGISGSQINPEVIRALASGSIIGKPRD